MRRRVREEYWHEGTKRMQCKVFVFYDVYINNVLTETVTGTNWQSWTRKHRDQVALYEARTTEAAAKVLDELKREGF